MTDDARAVHMTRRFEVPVERLYDAWTDPDQACRWMGPRGVDCRIDAWHFHEGGEFRIVMVSGEGGEYPAEGEFRRIDPPRALTMTWIWQHDDAMQGIETLLHLDFEADGEGAAILRLTHSLMPSDNAVERHTEGWTSALECLAEHLTA